MWVYRRRSQVEQNTLRLQEMSQVSERVGCVEDRGDRSGRGVGATVATPIHIVGGGLAGSEAAWQLAERGFSVVIHEMRPVRTTPAHKTENLAELVCSNTFKSTE